MDKRLWCSVLALGLGSWVSAQALKVGIIQELAEFGPGVQAVFNSAGVPAELIPESSARLVADLQSGSLDGGFLVSETALASVPNMKKIPVVLYQNDYIAVTVRKDLRIRTVVDLSHLRVGYVRGNQTFEALLRQVPAAIGQDLTDTPQVFKMLGGGRVDVILSTPPAVEIFGSLAEKPLYSQEPPLLSVPLYIVISNRLEVPLTKLTAAFERSKKNGEWAKTVQAAFEAIRTRSAKP